MHEYSPENLNLFTFNELEDILCTLIMSHSHHFPCVMIVLSIQVESFSL